MDKKLVFVIAVVLIAAGTAIGMGLNKNPKADSRTPELEQLPFVKDGGLMLGEFSRRGNIITEMNSRVIRDNVARVIQFQENTNKVLFLSKGSPSQDGDLILMDLASGETKVIMTEAIGGQIAPDGQSIVAWSGKQELVIFTEEGDEREKLSGHGAAPIFSHDGRFIAYEKLADESFDGNEQSLFEDAFGIALYDRSERSTHILTETEEGEDYAPIGFSADLSRLYFNSTRNALGSLWVVNIDGTNLAQILLSSDPEVIVSAVSQNALWSSDRVGVVSMVDNEVYLLRFTDDGRSLAEYKNLGKANSIRWGMQDFSIVSYDTENGIGWQVLKLE
jgi:Tol biopolymer transport system component